MRARRRPPPAEQWVTALRPTLRPVSAAHPERAFHAAVTAAAREHDGGPRATLAAVAVALAEALDAGPAAAALPLVAAGLESGAGPCPRRLSLARPELLGTLHELLLAPAGRRRAGAFYTPPAIATGVVAAGLDGLPEPASGEALRVCDPAVGGGAFLLAVARRGLAAGQRAERVVPALVGVDVDDLAVAVADTALGLLALEQGAAVRARLAVADALTLRGAADLGAESFDAVVGNPPFLGQLSRSTARSAVDRVRLRERFGAAVHRYADTALLFALLGLDLVRDGGRVALILPESVLGAADAAPARAAIGRRARPVWLWRDGGQAFAANVRTCALALEATPSAGRVTVRRATGADFAAVAPIEADAARLAQGAGWAALVADLVGAPLLSIDLQSSVRLGAYCTATADFRDQYYGLVPFVGDDLPPSRPKLVTVGMLDPARCWWGRRPARFGGRAFARPRVDLPRLARADDALGRWARARLVPKVLLATQTRVLEPAVDERGAWLPSVPAISVLPLAGRLWHVAAALASPVAAAAALHETAGTGLAGSAIRLAARGVTALPAPAEGADWDAAAVAFREASRARGGPGWRAGLERAAAASCCAYGLDAAGTATLVAWWRERLPPWRD